MLIKELSSLTSPLSELQLSSLQQALNGLSPTQTAWVSGYLAGISQASGQQSLPTTQAEVANSARLTILFGSQTGNAKGVAEELFNQAQAQNMPVRLVNMADYKAKELKTETHLLIVASTNGEGEAPDDAIAFHEFLASKKAPKVESLQYSVCALGDSSYEFYCQTGLEFDERLAALGAQTLQQRVDCDVDYDDAVTVWSEQVLAKVKETLSTTVTSAAPANFAGHVANQYSKKKPFKTELLTNQKITGRFSGKDIRHFEIALDDASISYQAGDALGIWFKNSPELVDELIAQLALDAAETVSLSAQELSLRDALIGGLELTQSYPSFVIAYAEFANSEQLNQLITDKNALRDYCYGRQIIDVVTEHKADINATQLVASLRKITPRLYSIASSPNEAEGEVHLTVAVVDYQQNDAQRIGGASGFLQRLEEGGKIEVFVEHNDNFRLPADANTPVIMIGPGTGIAPFRAFMQERDVQAAAGDNWLFFGNQHFTDDFLYQTEWQAYLKSGLLNKLDVAFSRDQAEKIYVQDRLRENAADVFAWLERGTHLYVCGDADKMAKDVNEALIDIVAQQGKLARGDAEEYIAELRRNKRYQRDVY